jgi:carbonic anhydrase
MRACEAEPPEGSGELVERAAIEISLDNLMTFPWIAGPVKAGRLGLHGWWFDLQKGELWGYDATKRSFAKMV